MRALLCEVRKFCTNRPYQLATCYFKQRLTVTMWKFHDWTAAHGTKKGWGSLTGSCLPSYPIFHKTLQYLGCQCPLKGGTLPHTPVPPSDTTANPLLTSVRTPSHRTIQSPVSWQILCLSSCVGQTSHAQLPTARSALQYSTPFKQEPLRPPVNHLAHLPHPKTMD